MRVLTGSITTVSADGIEVMLTAPTKNNSYSYFVFSGMGSSANLDLCIDEIID